MAEIVMIAAYGKGQAIGAGNKIPWHYPEDFKHFKQTTLNHPVIMGRKTYESIGRPLPKRTNYVVTRGESIDGVVTCRSPDVALEKAKAEVGDGMVFIMGGEQIYRWGMPFADRLIITEVPDVVDGADAFFPTIPLEFTPGATFPIQTAKGPELLVVEYRR